MVTCRSFYKSKDKIREEEGAEAEENKAIQSEAKENTFRNRRACPKLLSRLLEQSNSKAAQATP